MRINPMPQSSGSKASGRDPEHHSQEGRLSLWTCGPHPSGPPKAGGEGRQQKARRELSKQALSGDQEMLASPTAEGRKLLGSAGQSIDLGPPKGRPVLEWAGTAGPHLPLRGEPPLLGKRPPNENTAAPWAAVTRSRRRPRATCWEGLILCVQECRWIFPSNVTLM